MIMNKKLDVNHIRTVFHPYNVNYEVVNRFMDQKL